LTTISEIVSKACGITFDDGDNDMIHNDIIIIVIKRTTITRLIQEILFFLYHKEKKANDEQGFQTSGITAFYVEFYNRLDEVDSSGKFEAVLGEGSRSISLI
jgi:hypothetical protein